MLQVKDLKFYYKKTDITYNYTFSAKKAQVISIMGKSGSGKSTLLDILSGFLEPISGTATFDEKDFLSLPPDKRPITILFQSYNLFEYLSVEKNIAVGIDGSFKVDNRKKKIISDILSQMNLKGFEKRIASTLSGGEQQRVALSRALVRDKPVLLLDEPFNGLDKDTKKSILLLIKEITEKNSLSTVMVTHDEYDAELIADKIFTIKNGVLSPL